MTRSLVPGDLEETLQRLLNEREKRIGTVDSENDQWLVVVLVHPLTRCLVHGRKESDGLADIAVGEHRPISPRQVLK